MKISRQTREIINIVVFLVVVAALLVTYVIYPLSRTKAMMARYDIDSYSTDSILVNDPGAWVEAGMEADTFRVETDALTELAGLYVAPDSTVGDSVRGTLFLLHDDNETRDSLMTLAQGFAESGYAVVAYDQRAAGRSSAKYHGDGLYEATDLAEVIRYLDLRDRVLHPLVVVGFGRGADAGLLAAKEDHRIDKVVAVRPYLSSRRMLDILRKRHDGYWFPFYRTVMWWWFKIRSGYDTPYREIDQIEPVACRALVLLPAGAENDKEVTRLRELSDPALLEIETLPADRSELLRRVRSFVMENR